MIVELKSKEKVIYAEIMTFLSKIRTRETYCEKISTKSKSLQNLTRIVLDSFDNFCNIEYSHNAEQVIQELLGLKQTESFLFVCVISSKQYQNPHKKQFGTNQSNYGNVGNH